MDYNLDIEKFKAYFHYGLKYEQGDILDAIIISCSKNVNKMNLETVQTNMNRLEYAIDAIKNLYVQFERFIKLTADNNKNWYKKIDKDTVNDVVMQRIEYLKEKDMISVVEYKPMYGIYATDRGVPTETGMQRYENIPDWIKDDIVPSLEYLSELEQKNPYQYNSLFLDTKYARSINSGNKSSVEKIKSCYTLFIEMAKPAKEDVYQMLGENITRNDKKYIEDNYADYWTITNLKEKAKSDKYIDKVKQQCENIRCQDLNER